MTDLVAFVSSGKGTWTNVLRLASRSEFKNVFLIVNDWAKERLNLEQKNVCFVTINTEATHEVIRDSIIAQLKGKIMDLEVALNIDSGAGNEHAALISALVKLGLSFRLIVLEGEKIKDLTGNEADFFESNI